MDFVISEISCHHALISLRSVVAVILAPIALAACSSVPDYANPVEWYKSTAEFVVGAEEGAEGEDELVEEAEAHGEGDFPALADTPNPEGRAPTVEEMEAVEEGLVADKEHARYTDEVIRRNSQEELIVAAAPPASLAAPSGKSPAPEVPREPPTVIPKPDFGPPPNTEIETQTPRQSPAALGRDFPKTQGNTAADDVCRCAHAASRRAGRRGKPRQISFRRLRGQRHDHSRPERVPEPGRHRRRQRHRTSADRFQRRVSAGNFCACGRDYLPDRLGDVA